MGIVRIISILMITLLILGGTLVIFSAPTAAGSTPPRRFGFWVSGNDIGPPFYTPDQFAKAMFLTPPYPSSAEFMMFGAYKDIQAGTSNPVNGQFTKTDLSNLNGIASVADAYPNVQINVMVALGDLSDPLALTYFHYYVANLASHHSIYSIGLEGEYSSVVTTALETPLMLASQAAGKQYIDYYKSAVGSTIKHTNWPSYEYSNLLYQQGGSVVGISSGYDSGFPFPDTRFSGCNNTVAASGYGWSRQAVSCALASAVSIPVQYREFVHFAAGADSSGSFIGASGVSTNQMWDNPTLRNWIWNDPNYHGNFILSTSVVASTTASTSTARTSTTASGSTSSHSISTSTILSSSIATTRSQSTTSNTYVPPPPSSTSTITAPPSATTSQTTVTTSSTATASPTSSSATSTSQSSSSQTTTEGTTAYTSEQHSTTSGTPSTQSSIKENSGSEAQSPSGIAIIPPVLGVGAGLAVGFAVLTATERFGFSWKDSKVRRKRKVNRFTKALRKRFGALSKLRYLMTLRKVRALGRASVRALRRVLRF